MSTTDEAPPQVGTYEELDLDVIRPTSRTLKIGGQGYPVAATLSIPMMGSLLALETDIRSAGNDPDVPEDGAPDYVVQAYQAKIDENRRKAVDAMNAAHDAIVDLIQVESPGAHLQLSVNEVLLVIRWLVRNPDGAAGAVAALVTDAGGETKAGDDEDPEGEAKPPGAAPDAAPLQSAKRSSKRSSGTAASRA